MEGEKEKDFCNECVIMKEMEKLREEVAEMKCISTIDYLTGIYNKRYLEERLTGEIKRAGRFKETISLLMIDVDNFKNVNDTLGHLIGDQILKCVAQSILSGIRGCDIFARFGGDEFVIIAPCTDISGAETLAHKVRKTVLQSCTCQKHEITLSVGVASLDFGSVNIPPGGARQYLITNADAAMFKAKKLGKNQVVIFN